VADEVANSFDYFAAAAVVVAAAAVDDVDMVHFCSSHRYATHSLDDFQLARTNYLQHEVMHEWG
jgi:hypothetical protein